MNQTERLPWGVAGYLPIIQSTWDQEYSDIRVFRFGKFAQISLPGLSEMHIAPESKVLGFGALGFSACTHYALGTMSGPIYESPLQFLAIRTVLSFDFW